MGCFCIHGPQQRTLTSPKPVRALRSDRTNDVTPQWSAELEQSLYGFNTVAIGE